MKQILVTLTDLTVPLALRFPETARYFPPHDPDAPRAAIEPASISDDEWRDFRAIGLTDDPRSECNALSGKATDVLAQFGRAVIHGVALRWHGFAWLLVAHSGVGKTTQYRCLEALRPGEFTVICGDRPILDFRGERVMVWPSPWNGKEGWHGAPASPLAGIIFLERGEEDRLRALTEREAILRTFTAWAYSAADAKTIEALAAFETKLLQSVPLWLLTVKTVPTPPAHLVKSPPAHAPVKPSPSGEGVTPQGVTDEGPPVAPSPAGQSSPVQSSPNGGSCPSAHTGAERGPSPVPCPPQDAPSDARSALGGEAGEAGRGDQISRPPQEAFSPVKRGEGGQLAVDEGPHGATLVQAPALPPLPDISAASELLLDAVFTDAILPRN